MRVWRRACCPSTAPAVYPSIHHTHTTEDAPTEDIGGEAGLQRRHYEGVELRAGICGRHPCCKIVSVCV